MKKLFLISLLLISHSLAKSQISRYSGNGVEQSLEKYEAQDLSSLKSLAEAKYKADVKAMKAQSDSFKEYYSSINYFKEPIDGLYSSTVIIDNIYKSSVNIQVRNKKVVSLEITSSGKRFNEINGLKSPSEIKNGYSKVFLDFDDKFMSLELFFPSLFLMDKPNN